MSRRTREPRIATCRCGRVEFAVHGPPILAGACYCRSCQEAGRRLEQLSYAPPLRDPDGGTRVVLYRKDRVRCATGGPPLEMRVMTKYRRAGVELAGDIPNHSGVSWKFIAQLMAARAAMGIGWSRDAALGPFPELAAGASDPAAATDREAQPRHSREQQR